MNNVMQKMTLSILAILPLLSNGNIEAESPKAVNVPSGDPILLDGKCSQDEWKDAADFYVANNYKVMVKKYGNYVCFCIKPSNPGTFVVDLYLSPSDNKLYTLHSSAKLGERTLKGDKWEDWRTDWNWWDVNGWWANTSMPTVFTKPEFLPNEAREYQIDRRRFGGNHWRIMLDIMESNSSFTIPATAGNLKKDSWMEINISDRH